VPALLAHCTPAQHRLLLLQVMMHKSQLRPVGRRKSCCCQVLCCNMLRRWEQLSARGMLLLLGRPRC
jgi:hypothetical protein